MQRNEAFHEWNKQIMDLSICTLNPDNLEQSGGFDNFDLVIFQIIWTTISLFKHQVMFLYLRGRGSWGSVKSASMIWSFVSP